MSSAALDRLLAVLVVALVGSGLVSLRFGAPGGGWLFVAHAILAGFLAGATIVKLRRSVPRSVRARRWARLAGGLTVSLLVVASLAAGYLWAASGTVAWVDVAGIGRWSLLTLHAWIGLVLVPFVVVHLLPRQWRLLRPGAGSARRMAGRLLSRRAVVGGLALGGVAVAASGSALVAERLLGGPRRFTGSRQLPEGSLPIPTTFFGEPTPALDVATWRLAVGDRAFSLDDLQALGAVETTATLDCTSGWAATTTWSGVSIARVLAAAGVSASSAVEVRSATGWAASLPPDELERCLLAWAMAGQPLPAANGAPLRLVAPDHRGLEWVKWVAELRVRDPSP